MIKKYEGTGNSFVVLFDDEREISREEFIAQHCQTTDGVIFVTNTENPFYYQMNFYNRDGSKADFCGNGSRCFLRFLLDKQKISIGEKVAFQTGYGFLQGEMTSRDFACVQMPQPTKPEPMSVEGYDGYFLQVGVPHFVVFLDSIELLENFDLMGEGSKIRNNPLFPKGTNVNFVAILSADTLRIRTFERGVEGETKACGSGSTASAVVYTNQFQKHLSSVKVQTNGGLLAILFEKNKLFCQGGVQDV